MTKHTLWLTIFITCILTIACQQGKPEPPSADSQSSTNPSVETPEPKAPEGAEDTDAVEYEPAYPTDVSSEKLSDEDVEQQETKHSHDGGEEHSHGDEGHSHGKDGTHDDPDH